MQRKNNDEKSYEIIEKAANKKRMKESTRLSANFIGLSYLKNIH